MKTVIIRFRQLLYRLKYKLPDGCSIGRNVTLRNSKLEGRNKIQKNSVLVDTKVGHSSFIGQNCTLVKTLIGKYCSLGEEVKIIYGNHPTRQFVSTYPAFYSAVAQYGYAFVNKTIFAEFSTVDGNTYVQIGHDVWIGSYAHIHSGVKIGDGAIIATGAVVTKDVPPYAIVGGVPAKIIRYRFDEDQIKYLEKFKWWDRDVNWLADNVGLFSDIEEFVNRSSK